MIRSRAYVIVAFAFFIKVSESQCTIATSTTNQQQLPILNNDNLNIAALSNLVKNVIFSLTGNNGLNANCQPQVQNNQQHPIHATAPNLLQLPSAPSSNLNVLYKTPTLTQNIAQVPSILPLQQANAFVPFSMATASPISNTLSASLPCTVPTGNSLVNQHSAVIPEYNEEPTILYMNAESQETPVSTQNSNSVGPLIEVAVMSEEVLSSLFSPVPQKQPHAVVVKAKKSSSLNKILPLLLMTLKDKSPSYSYPSYCSTNNHCCNNGCDCSHCNNMNNMNGPILYPIPIPINSPFVSSDVKV